MSVALSIVLLAALGVGEDLIGLRYLSELFVGGLARVYVRVVPAG